LYYESALGLCLSAAIFGAACAATPPKSPFAIFPEYGAEDASLLDDGLSGHLFENAFVTGVAGDDPHFKDRVSRAENIWVVKVATVSREGSSAGARRYELSFRPLRSLVGGLPTEPISLTISGKDPSFHWLDRVEGSWVGHELVLLVRRYRSRDGAVLHFHGEPDSAALRDQVLEIRRAPPAPK
jgi:hypothetical protein